MKYALYQVKTKTCKEKVLDEDIPEAAVTVFKFLK